MNSTQTTDFPVQQENFLFHETTKEMIFAFLVLETKTFPKTLSLKKKKFSFPKRDISHQITKQREINLDNLNISLTIGSPFIG